MRSVGRLEVSGVLEARTPLAVHDYDPDETAADMTFVRNGADWPIVPGSGLAGALAAWSQGWDDAELHSRLWGDVADPANDAGGRSRLLVDDVELIDGSDSSGERPADVHRRNGVGINRYTRSAADGVLYLAEYVDTCSWGDFSLVLDIPSDPDLERRLRKGVRSLVEALSVGRIRVGGSKTRGFGRVEAPVDELVVTERRLDAGPSGVLRALAADRQWSGRGALDRISRETRFEAAPLIRVEVNWRPNGPVMVAAGAEGVNADVIPLLGRDPVSGQIGMVIPGSSLKGVLRFTCERFMRTLLGAEWRTDPVTDLRHQVDVPLVSRMFGLAASARSTDRDDNGTGILGAVSVDGCVSLGLPGLKDHDLSVFDVAQAEREEIVSWLGVEIGTHVGLDRWTGGGADHLLFTKVEPWSAQWSPFTVELDVSGPDGPAALHFLLRALRELQVGSATFGGGSNQGYGTCVVESFDVTAFDTDLIASGEYRTVDDMAQQLSGCRDEFARFVERHRR